MYPENLFRAPVVFFSFPRRGVTVVEVARLVDVAVLMGTAWLVESVAAAAALTGGLLAVDAPAVDAPAVSPSCSCGGPEGVVEGPEDTVVTEPVMAEVVVEFFGVVVTVLLGVVTVLATVLAGSCLG